MSLSNTNNALFVLSNMPVACIKHLEENYDFWDIFSGKVISCRAQHVKPEPAIYQYLLNEYKLKPEETVFIDDMAINVAAAKSAGIKAIQFINTEQCEQALKELKVPVCQR